MGRHVGRRIAEIRKQKGMTQEYIASLYGRTPQWFSNIERGVRPISADNLAKLAVILGVEPGIFFATTKAKEDDECEDYERRDEDAQTQEAENADAGNN